MNMIKVHITDHHKMLVDGIYSLIDKSDFAIVSGISESLDDCRKALEKYQPDVLLTELSHVMNVDAGFPKRKNKKPALFYNGIDFCEDVKRVYPHIRIIVLTSYSNWTTIRRMLDIGVSGYVLKMSPLYEIMDAIDSVMDGNIYLCKKSILMLRKEIKEYFFWVTVREQELLRHIAMGFTNEQIGERLCCSHETIKTRRKILIQKFGGEGTINMLKKAMQMGLIWEDLIP
jgi:DNA-binding NarL/FixJ family response regulator